MQSLTEYMKKEIVFYIKQERDKGVPLTTIRKSLLSGGHHTNLVKEAMRSLKKHKFNLVKALNEPIKSNLDKELYFNIMNSLIKYSEHQIASGKSVNEVKKILSEYGHSKEVIEKAVNGVRAEERSPMKPIFKYLDTILLVLTLALIFIVSGVAKEPIELVALGFLPSILTIISLNLSVTSREIRKLFWIYPFVFSFGFMIVGLFGVFGVEQEFFRLTILNLIISVLYTYAKATKLIDLEKYNEILQNSVNTDSDVKQNSDKKISHNTKKENDKKSK